MRTEASDAFLAQRRCAKRRKIEFYFTYAEWERWWLVKLGPDWFTLRGRDKGKYCMARKGDKGPYASWNVECKTNFDNACERKQDPFQASHFKLNKKKVSEIRNSRFKETELASMYGVSRETINRVKNGKIWRDVP